MLSKRLDVITVKEMKAQGIDVLNLSVGEPDFNVPEKAKECGIKSLNDNITKYDLVPGLTILREEISKKLLEENNCHYAPDEIVVTSGAKMALTNTLMAVTDPGDEVLLVKPYWVSYSEMTKLVNAVPVGIETDKANDFKLTGELLEKYITEKTKMLILNNPCNPTGAIYTKEELLDICNVCLKHNIYILADEIYERICFNNKFVSVASLSDEIRNITITINGFAKSAALTGTRLGYSATPKIENLDYIYPQGAFYVFIDISKVKDKFEYKESLSSDFCDKFLEEYKVAIVPGIAFGIDEYVRISFACSEETFIEALDRLDKFVQGILA